MALLFPLLLELKQMTQDKTYLLGRRGKMGQAIAQVLASNQLEVADHLSDASLCIDFSSKEALIELLPKLLHQKTPLVSGTTGLFEEEFQLLKKASLSIPVFYSTNFSIGVFCFQKMLEIACKTLPILSATIQETHHLQKKDKPSGTAKMLYEILQKYRIQTDVTSIRKDEEIGKHQLDLNLENERITLTHIAKDRTIFAQGAVIASRFLIGKKPGLYSMDDLLSHHLSSIA